MAKKGQALSGLCSRKLVRVFLRSPAVAWSTRLVGVERVKNCSQRTQKVNDGWNEGRLGRSPLVNLFSHVFLFERQEQAIPGWDVSPIGFTSSIKFAGTQLYTWVEIGNICEWSALPKKQNTATQPARARTQTCSLIRFQYGLKSKGTLSWSFLASNRRQIRSKTRSKIGFLPHTSHPWMLLAVKAV